MFEYDRLFGLDDRDLEEGEDEDTLRVKSSLGSYYWIGWGFEGGGLFEYGAGVEGS